MGALVSDVEQNPVWAASFSGRNDPPRTRLLESFRRVHERIQHILTFIPRDMHGYTVHDISHLDALWEMAALILGGDPDLNPAELYVLAIAILLHDAGMTVAAFPGGEAELEMTPEWQDAFSILEKARRDSGRTEAEIKILATTSALRLLHARKAEELATQKWNSPDGSAEYLIQDDDLRHHYGEVIGKIAASHHWDADSLTDRLPAVVGSFGDMPIEWTVNPVRVALILRCSDAAHIDHRRAPRLLLTLTRPDTVSSVHWNFQKKIAKPTIKDHKVIYTSTSFTVEEVDAWQLCWETVQMIDRELSDATDILVENDWHPFNAIGVLGAKSPLLLAQTVPVSGWKPVSTAIQVSDVPQLARSLGGRDLYGYRFAPLRELLQNSADAIDARTAVDVDFGQEEARIVVRVSKAGGQIALHIEDNGIGMSERTLTGALLDFGVSFWRTEAAKLEFPGLQTKFKQPRGRYGIGFFSTFMWSNAVTIVTRKYSAGLSEAWVLEFREGLNKNPVLREPLPGEASTKFSTRITLRIDADSFEKSVREQYEAHSYSIRYDRPKWGLPKLDWKSAVNEICGTLPFKVFVDIDGVLEQVGLPDWKNSTQDQFLNFLQTLYGSFDDRVLRFSRAESNVVGDDGVTGRAFLAPSFGERYSTSGPSSYFVYEQGIFVGRREGGICGIVEGRASNIARDRTDVESPGDNSEWLDKQEDYLFRISESLGETLRCQEAFLRQGRLVRTQPLFINNREFLSFDRLLEVVKKRGEYCLRLHENRNESFEWSASRDLQLLTGLSVDPRYVYPLVDFSTNVDGGDSLRELCKSGGDSLFARIVFELTSAVGEGADIKYEMVPQDSYSRDEDLLLVVRGNLV